MMRIIRQLFFLLLLILIGLGFFCFTLLNTEYGTQQIWKYLKPHLPKTLQMTAPQGILSKHLQIRKLIYQTPTERIIIKNIQLTWQPSQLLHKTLHIQQLKVNTFRLESFEPLEKPLVMEKPKHPIHINLPIIIRIDDLKLNSYHWVKNHKSLLRLKRLSGLAYLNLAQKSHVQCHWAQLILPSHSEKTLQINQGQLTAIAHHTHYRAQLNATLVSPYQQHYAWQRYAWQNQMEGNHQRLKWQSTLSQKNRAILQLDAQLAWVRQFIWNAHLTLNHLNLNSFLNQWPSQLSGELDTQGHWSRHKKSIQFKLNDLHGELRHYPLQSQAEIHWTPTQLRIKQFNLHIDDAELQVDGELKRIWQMMWKINIPHLNVLIPDAQGKMMSTGQFTGSRTQPRIIGKLALTHLHYQFLHSQQLMSDFDLNTAPQSLSHILLTIQALQLKQTLIQNIQLNGQGNPQQQHYSLTIKAPQQQLKTQVQVQKQNHIWQLTFSDWYLHLHQTPWQLSQTHPIIITSQGEVTIPPLALAAREQQLTLAGYYFNSQQWLLNTELTHLQLQVLNDFLPTEMKLNGSVDLSLVAEQNQQHSQAKLNLILNPTTISLPYQGQVITQPIKKGRLTGELNANGLTSHLQLFFSSQESAQGQIHLPELTQFRSPQENDPVTATFNFDSHQLQLLTILIPEISNPQGHFSAQIQGTGTLGAPKLLGQLKLSEGQFIIPTLNSTFHHIQLEAKTSDFNHFNLLGNVRSGSGNLTLQGTLQPTLPSITMHIVGKQFQIANTQFMQINLQPDLTLDYQANQLDLRGILEIPSAQFTLANQFNSTRVTPDAQIIQAAKPQHLPLAINTTLTLILDPAVHLKACGLSGNLSGKIQLRQTTPYPSTAVGTLEISNGEFNAYGKTLKIQMGKILFLGGVVTNPNINMRAIKTLQLSSTATNTPTMPIPGGELFSNASGFSDTGTLNVGIAASGALLQPNITLFSEPAGLSQADILSYIVLDAPANQASAGSLSLLFSATQALHLGDTQSAEIKDQIKNALGLDVVNVASTQQYNQQTGTLEQNTSLILGKYLTPKIYIDYSVGIMSENNILQLTYELNKHWSIKTQASTASTGADLFYALTRD